MKFSAKYLDMYDRETELTPEELDYFHCTADLCRRAAGVSVSIYCRDHERAFSDKSKNALGVFYTSDPKNPNADCFISIDNYFIHECYMAEFHKGLRIEPQTLEEVICHELAHMERFRHGKSHRALTEAYLQKVNDAKQAKPSFNALISAAKEKAEAVSAASMTHTGYIQPEKER